MGQQQRGQRRPRPLRVRREREQQWQQQQQRSNVQRSTTTTTSSTSATATTAAAAAATVPVVVQSPVLLRLPRRVRGGRTGSHLLALALLWHAHRAANHRLVAQPLPRLSHRPHVRLRRLQDALSLLHAQHLAARHAAHVRAERDKRQRLAPHLAQLPEHVSDEQRVRVGHLGREGPEHTRQVHRSQSQPAVPRLLGQHLGRLRLRSEQARQGHMRATRLLQARSHRVQVQDRSPRHQVCRQARPLRLRGKFNQKQTQANKKGVVFK